MYVYLVIVGWYYDGSQVEDVVSSKIRATQIAQELKEKRMYDYVDIEKWKVNGDNEDVEQENFYTKVSRERR